MSGHLRDDLIDGLIHDPDRFIELSGIMVVVITVLQVFVPKVFLEIWHHHVCIDALHHPKVDPVGHKSKPEVVHCRFIITGRRELCCCPETVKDPVYGGVLQWFIRILPGKEPPGAVTKLIAQVFVILPAQGRKIICHIYKAVFAAFGVQDRQYAIGKVDLFSGNAAAFRVPQTTAI
jgi:hypothetical protein